MSRIVSVFLADPARVSNVIEFFNDEFSFPLEKDSDVHPAFFWGESLGIMFSCFDQHGLENDRELLFELFPIQINLELVKRFKATKYADDFLLSAAKYIAIIASERLGTKVMVVDDLQTLVPL